MSKQKRLKKELGTGYRFEQRFSAKNLARMLERLEGSNHFCVVAILTAGAVRLEAVVYWDNGKYSLGYDLMVKDTPFSPEWMERSEADGEWYIQHLPCRYRIPTEQKWIEDCSRGSSCDLWYFCGLPARKEFPGNRGETECGSGIGQELE